jgi:hypothetical protein
MTLFSRPKLLKIAEENPENYKIYGNNSVLGAFPEINKIKHGFMIVEE